MAIVSVELPSAVLPAVSVTQTSLVELILSIRVWVFVYAAPALTAEIENNEKIIDINEWKGKSVQTEIYDVLEIESKNTNEVTDADKLQLKEYIKICAVYFFFSADNAGAN